MMSHTLAGQLLELPDQTVKVSVDGEVRHVCTGIDVTVNTVVIKTAGERSKEGGAL